MAKANKIINNNKNIVTLQQKPPKWRYNYLAKDQSRIKQKMEQKAAERNKGRKIAAGVCFYNDLLSLRRTLESLQKDNVDLIICVDGRFKHFGTPGKYPDLSDDGSRELVLSYDNTVLIDMPDSWETQKRQAYVEACEDFNIDYLLIIDSDEYILYDDHDPKAGTHWDQFIETMIAVCERKNYINYNVFGIDVENNNKNYVDTVKTLLKWDKTKTFIQHPNPAPTVPFRRRTFMNLPRLWHRPSEMTYNGKHYAFHPKDPNHPLHKLESVSSTWPIPNLYIGHDHLYKRTDKQKLTDRLYYQKFLIEFEQYKVNALFNAGRYHIDPKDMDKVLGWFQELEDLKRYQRREVESFNALREKVKAEARLKRIQEQQKKDIEELKQHDDKVAINTMKEIVNEVEAQAQAQTSS